MAPAGHSGARLFIFAAREFIAAPIDMPPQAGMKRCYAAITPRRARHARASPWPCHAGADIGDDAHAAHARGGHMSLRDAADAISLGHLYLSQSQQMGYSKRHD